jgi:Rieske Fe-S protein
MAHPERRSFLRVVSGALMAAVGAVLAVPIAALLGAPVRKRTVYGGEEPLPVGDLAKLPEGVPVAVKVVAPERFDAWLKVTDVPLGAVWLLRRGDEVRCWSSTCPHAGCFVDYRASDQRFACPCHKSEFDLDGQRVGGPAPRGMDRLDTEVKDGKVLVRFQRFRQATSSKEPV